MIARNGSDRGAGVLARCAALALVAALPACAPSQLVEGGGLSSYDGMTTSNGMIAKSRIFVSKEAVLAAQTVNIAPSSFPPGAGPKLTDKQRAVVANAVDRALCVSLSDRFRVVRLGEPADLTVRARVTQATGTNEVAAGASIAANLGMSFVDTGAVPVPVPRIPIGLGSLSIEAEATDSEGRPQASMVWGKGANALFSSPRASKAGDAYELALSFGEDFAALLVKGESPFEGGFGIDLPRPHRMASAVGLAPKYAACAEFGRAPGVVGLVGSQIGLPPEWTDRGPGKPAGEGPTSVAPSAGALAAERR